MKISLVTTCKGRLHHLRETLPANLKAAEGDPDVEFVIVDYNSLDGMRAWAEKELAEHIRSGRVVYIHEKTAQYHSMSRSKNIGFLCASGDVAVNVDADNFISDSYLPEIRKLFMESSRVFITGPLVITNDGTIDGTYGRVAMPMQMFHAIRGYDEAMSGWGAEECDLYDRGRAAGYVHLKLDIWKIGRAIPHGDEERYLKNFDPSTDRLMSAWANRRIVKSRAAGAAINPSGYGVARIYRNFLPEPIQVGAAPEASKCEPITVSERGWKSASGKPLLSTIMDYRDRANVMMCKAWIVRARKHCPDWDIVIAHVGDISEIMKFASRFKGISFERYDITRNEIRREVCGKFGTNAQNYKIPYLRHVHEAKWPPFVFVDADAMICGDISDLASAVNDKPFVATTESRPPWMNGLRIVNSGVFAYRPESGLLSYDRLLAEWRRTGGELKYPTGEQGLMIPMLHRENYDWEHPKIGPEYNVLGHAAVFSGFGPTFKVSIAETPCEGTPEWVARWIGYGSKKEPKIVHAISQFKWWNTAHLNPMWEQLVWEVLETEKG